MGVHGTVRFVYSTFLPLTISSFNGMGPARTVALGNGMMQSSLSIRVGCIQRALPLADEQVDHRGRAYGRGAVESILASAVAYPGGGGWFLVEELAGNVEVVLGGSKV